MNRQHTDTHRILVVEDVDICRQQAETILKDAGFDVEGVSDGKSAVDAVQRSPEGYYSLILMDIQMPVMSGYEAVRIIRGLDRTDVFSLPIVALTALSGMNDKIDSFGSGMNDHLTKPFSADDLIATIRKFLPEQ